MGKGLKKVASIVPATSILTGKGPAAKLLGLEEKQGEFNDQQDLQSYLRTADPNVDPITGMDRATKYTQENALTKGVFGQGGVQSQLESEGKDLASRGFSLQKDDREAYGQTAGDISRLFGQQENQAAQSLARRGLGAGSSGAAGAMYSGLAGNKNEMLAKAQLNIAQKRMADTQQRLLQNRALQSQLAGQGSDLSNRQYQNQVEGRQRRIGELSALEASKSQVMGDKQAAFKEGGLLKGFGRGLQAGTSQLGAQLPGMLATGGMSAGAGALGSSGGSSMAGLFGQGGGASAGSALGTPNQTFSGMPLNFKSYNTKTYG